MVNTPECLIAEEARAPPSAFFTPGLLLFPRNEGRSRRSWRRGQPNKHPLRSRC